MDKVEESTEVLEDNETSHEDLSEAEGNDAEASEESESDTITLTKDELDAKLKERAKEQDQRWKDRIKKGGIEIKEDSEESSQEGDKESHQEDSKKEVDYRRLELKIDGITDKKQQDVILEYADWKGIEVSEAAKSPVVKAELKQLETKASTPRPSVRTGSGGEASVDTLVARYRAGKKLSTEEFKKVRNHLRG